MTNDERLRHPAEAWRIVLRTGRDPDGCYTLHPSLLPALRAQELSEIRRDISYKKERLAELHKEVRKRQHSPEEVRRAERRLRRCEENLLRLQQDKRFVLSHPSKTSNQVKVCAW